MKLRLRYRAIEPTGLLLMFGTQQRYFLQEHIVKDSTLVEEIVSLGRQPVNKRSELEEG